jgi:hypothetical protein
MDLGDLGVDLDDGLSLAERGCEITTWRTAIRITIFWPTTSSSMLRIERSSWMHGSKIQW